MRLCLAVAATALALYLAAVTPLRTGAPGGAWSAHFSGERVTLTLRPRTDQRAVLVVPRAALDGLSIGQTRGVAASSAAPIEFTLAHAGIRLRFQGTLQGDTASGRYSPAPPTTSESQS